MTNEEHSVKELITETNGESSGQNTLKAKTSKRVAWLLDECIRIPGTQIKFGLDPIVGMIPGGGEILATLVGATVLGESAKRGIPIKTLIRMGGNMILNALVGLCPGLGDLFSVWFKSNKRNYEMLNEYLESTDGEQSRGGWWPLFVVFIIVGTVLAINVFVIGAILFVLTWFWNKADLPVITW